MSFFWPGVIETPARKAASSIMVSSICNVGFCEAISQRAPAKKFEVTPIPAQAARKRGGLACQTRLFIGIGSFSLVVEGLGNINVAGGVSRARLQLGGARLRNSGIAFAGRSRASVGMWSTTSRRCRAVGGGSAAFTRGALNNNEKPLC